MTDVQTDHFTPCACAWGNNEVDLGMKYAFFAQLSLGHPLLVMLDYIISALGKVACSGL